MESLLQVCKVNLNGKLSPFAVQTRNLKNYKSIKTSLLGVPPYKGKSLAQKLAERNYKDPDIHFKVNIGLPQIVQKNKGLLEERRAHFKNLKNDTDLEKKSRENKLSICLQEVSKEWLKQSGAEHMKKAAEYYGVFADLFGDAYFYPQVNLDVSFKQEDYLLPVCRGNPIKPKQALCAPEVTFDADPDSLWTLVVTNPDGHLEEENAEYLHWLVGNISGNSLSQADLIADYVQPFPARGTGFHRLIFLLYKQSQKMDYSSFKLSSSEVDWKQRIFKTYDFYRDRQEQLTPAGLAFCQVDWDNSVSRFFHTELGVEEPVYEYDFDPPYYTKQKMFPLKQAFNLYMDRYRDPKQIAKEYLLKKLKNRHPFKAPDPPLKYPNAVPVYHDLDSKLYGRIPSWLRLQKVKERMGYGRINDY